jgi:ribosomal RNA-processing protein 17
MAPPRKRLKTVAVEEITFDPAAREEYLTGFHKRKQARIKHAQEQAAKREREERIQERKEVCVTAVWWDRRIYWLICWI